MRTVRISDLRRGHLRAEFVPKLRVESFHRSDSAGCTIVTIERHSPDRFSTGPLYICAPRARGLAPSRVFLLYRTDHRLPTPPRTAPFWVSAEVLANHRRDVLDCNIDGARHAMRQLSAETRIGLNFEFHADVAVANFGCNLRNRGPYGAKLR